MRRLLAYGLRDRSRGLLSRCSAGRRTCAIVLLCVLMAIVSPAQTFTSLLSFNGSNGADPGFPYGMSLVQGLDGNFYGTTGNAGSGIVGTVFKITPGGTLTTLYSFAAGVQPSGGLVLAPDGNFYGTTSNGGTKDSGTVFRITPSGAFKVLYSFCVQANCADGANPRAGLVQGTDGRLYGTTDHGGASNQGTVFEFAANGTLNTLYRFCSQTNCWDGSHPRAALIQAGGGDFYGTTREGGTHQAGTIFKITATRHVLTTLYSFCAQTNCADGKGPVAALIQAADGSFYSTTELGGVNSGGTVFKITPKGTFRTLYSFCSQTRCADGGGPAGLVQASDGNFYGTTGGGGSNDNGVGGTVFEVTSGGTLTTLYSFCAQTLCTDGELPQGGVVQGTDGNFYGTTEHGGTSANCVDNCGTVFTLSTGLTPFVEALPYTAKVGKSIVILGQGLTGTTAVSFNETAATFIVQSDTYLTATVPVGATSGFITVAAPGGLLTSNKQFRVLQ